MLFLTIDGFKSLVNYMIRRKIRTKLLIVIAILVLLSLGATDWIWFTTVKLILTDKMVTAENQLADKAGNKIDNFIQTKIRALTIHTQSAAFLTQNADLEKVELSTLFLQDRDLIRLSLIDQTGMEVLAYTPTEEIPQAQLKNESSSPAYLVPFSQFAKEYVSDVAFDAENHATMVLAIPIVIPQQIQQLTQLSTTFSSHLSHVGEITGVLKATIRLDDLLEEVSELSSTSVGTIYVIDRQGVVISHPDKSLVGQSFAAKNYPPVLEHLARVQKRSASQIADPNQQYISESNIPSIGGSITVGNTNWGVIVQQPTAIALQEFHRITVLTILFLIGGLIITIPIAFIFSHRLTQPLKILVDAANQISTGHFDYKFQVNTHDEIQDLGHAFKNMAFRLRRSINKMKKDQDLISAEKNKMSVVLYGTVDGIIALDSKRRISLINKAAVHLLGIKDTDVIGKSIENLLSMYSTETKEEQPIPVDALLPTKLNQNKDVIIFQKSNVLLKTASNKQKYVNIISASIKEGDLVNLGCILTIHDVTEERMLQDMKLDFVSMAAHELRTPLTALRGYLSFLVTDSTSKLNQEEQLFLTRALTSATNLNSLIENLLNVSRIEQGHLENKLKAVQLEELAKKVTLELNDLSTSKGLELKIRTPKNTLPLVNADPFRIEEVLRNLIGNAINYSQKGSIEISFEEKDGFVTTKVSDTGQGIPAEALPHLFSKFFRVQGALESGSKGTGLGLYITKHIIESHGGTITVDSTVGKGSTFAFALPLFHG